MVITLSLDTCCFDKKSYELLLELRNLKKDGVIEIFRELDSDIETDRYMGDRIKKMYIMESISTAPLDAFGIPEQIDKKGPEYVYKYLEQQRGYTAKEYDEVFKKLSDAIYPEGLYQGKKLLNKYIDIKLLTLHILRKHSFFVTKDKKGFLENRKLGRLRSIYPHLEIRELNKEFLDELKLICKKS